MKINLSGSGPFVMPQLVVGARVSDEQNISIPLRARPGKPRIFSALLPRHQLERDLYIIPSLNRCQIDRLVVTIEQATELSAYFSFITMILKHPSLIVRSVLQENLGYRFEARSGKVSAKTIFNSLKELAARNLPDPDSLRLGKDRKYNYWLNARYETLVPRRKLRTESIPFPLKVAVLYRTSSGQSDIEVTINSLLAAGIRKDRVEILGPETGPNDFPGKNSLEERVFIDSLQSSDEKGFLMVMSAGDTVSRTFLEECMDHIPKSNCELIYFDSDHLTPDGTYYNYEFKPDNSPTTLLFHDYTRRSSLINLRLLRSIFSTSKAFLDFTLPAAAYYCAMEASQDVENSPLHIAMPLIHHVHQANDINDEESIEIARTAALEKYAPNFSISATKEFPRWKAKFPTTRKVSIIIPTRNQEPLIKAAVNSILAKTSYQAFEIIIIDNQSDDPKTLAYLSDLAKEPKIRIRRYPEEFNFAKMHNAVIPELDTDLVLLLNNDTEITSPHWLKSLVDLFELPRVGIVGNKLIYPDGTIQHAGATGGLRGPMSHHLSGASQGSHPILNYPRDVLAVTGACLLIPKSIYIESGGMDEALGVSYNDMDLCLAVRTRFNRRVVVSSSGGVIHKESKTRGTSFSVKEQNLLNDEARYFEMKWRHQIRPDPYYNRNLSLDRDFDLA